MFLRINFFSSDYSSHVSPFLLRGARRLSGPDHTIQHLILAASEGPLLCNRDATKRIKPPSPRKKLPRGRQLVGALCLLIARKPPQIGSQREFRRFHIRTRIAGESQALLPALAARSSSVSRAATCALKKVPERSGSQTIRRVGAHWHAFKNATRSASSCGDSCWSRPAGITETVPGRISSISRREIRAS